jgi:hypothetical protein
MAVAIVADALAKTYRTYKKQEGLLAAINHKF